MTIDKIFKSTFFTLFLSALISCSSDSESKIDAPQSEGYKTQVYLTDAPSDNAEVEAVFITIADVKINGKSLKGFQKTTVEISSLTNGETELLGNVNLEEGSTSSISIVLDNDADESGTAPGNYVILSGGEKKVLTSTSSEISITDNAEILAADSNELVLDFDLRKAIVADSDGGYSFAGNSGLSNSVRAVNTQNAGTITGKVSNNESFDAESMLVFAYESGSYSESEMEQSADGVRFSNAVTSSVVSESNGEFSIHFLEEGNYELHFISFSDEDKDNELELEGEVEMSTSSEIDIFDVVVTADSTTNIEVLLTGLLDL